MKRKNYLRPKEFAERLAISRWTVYTMVYDGGIRAVKIGRLLRIPEGEICRLIRRPPSPGLAVGERIIDGVEPNHPTTSD